MNRLKERKMDGVRRVSRELMSYYITAKRLFFSKPIPFPRDNSQAMGDMRFLTYILNERKIDPLEFLMVQIRASKRRNKFPEIHHLLNRKAFIRYKISKRLEKAR